MSTQKKIDALYSRSVRVAERLARRGVNVTVQMTHAGKTDDGQLGREVRVGTTVGITVAALEALADKLDGGTQEEAPFPTAGAVDA